MSAEEKKRKRAVNFTPREQNLLFSIALKYKTVIENKVTNASSNSAKNEAWQKITTEFNATSVDFNNRSSEQLKRFYENKKMLAKKKVADRRQNILKTGGGPPSPKNEDDELILSTMDPLTFEGLENLFDSDSVKTINLSTDDMNKYENIELIFEQSEKNEMSKEMPQQAKISGNKTLSLENNNYLENQNHLENDNDWENDNYSEKGGENIEESMSSCAMLSTADTEISEKHNWKKYSTNDLKRPLNPSLSRPESKKFLKECGNQSLQQPTREKPKPKNVKDGNRCIRSATMAKDRRRPTATVVRSLASNALAQKYNELADKKNVIADHTIKKVERERLYAEEEHQLKIKNLELDLQIKKKQLQKLSNI